MHASFKIALAACALLGTSGVASAQTTFHSGKIVSVFADPADLVVTLDVNGRCGSSFFHVQRASVNLKEMTAVALTAFSMGKTMGFFVTSCVSDRNITSHGVVSR